MQLGQLRQPRASGAPVCASSGVFRVPKPKGRSVWRACAPQTPNISCYVTRLFEKDRHVFLENPKRNGQFGSLEAGTVGIQGSDHRTNCHGFCEAWHSDCHLNVMSPHACVKLQCFDMSLDQPLGYSSFVRSIAIGPKYNIVFWAQNKSTTGRAFEAASSDHALS